MLTVMVHGSVGTNATLESGAEEHAGLGGSSTWWPALATAPHQGVSDY